MKLLTPVSSICGPTALLNPLLNTHADWTTGTINQNHANAPSSCK
jgi:hypothetical protein